MDVSTEALIQAVTQQVLAALKQENKCPEIRNEGKSKCLVLGDTDKIPESLKWNAVLLGLEDYESHQNIACYDRVVITALSLADLADVALGRAGTRSSCAICQALLCGTEVLLLESALPHRAHAGQGSTAFYHMLEGYVTTLQVFGVKLLGGGDKVRALQAERNRPRDSVRREVAGERLITERMALELVKGAQELVIPADTLITPAAMDVFKGVKAKLTRK